MEIQPDRKRWFANDRQFKELERLTAMLHVAVNPQMIVRDSSLENTMPEAERIALIETLKMEIADFLEQAQIDHGLRHSAFAEALKEFDRDFYPEVVALEAEEEAAGPWEMEELRVKLEGEGIETRDSGQYGDDERPI